MKHTFHNKRISSILSILPTKTVCYSDEILEYPFPESQSRRLGRMMDYNTRRICEKDDGIADYACYGIKKMIEANILDKNEIDAIVVTSSSQDYIIPSVSYLIHGELELAEDVFCCDIAQACGGYIIGLNQAFMLLDTYHLKKVLLVAGDMLSKKIGKRDRNSRPIIGDAVTISVIENSTGTNSICSSIKNFGKGSASIIGIPAGGMKYPSSAETAVEEMDSFGNYRSQNDFLMNGEVVFDFAMRQVPSMIDDLLSYSNHSKDDIDYYIFHQPNKYMINKLADEMEIPYEKLFGNIVGIYGNSSTATIPLNICHNIKDKVLASDTFLCLSGFGAGLICDAMTFPLEKVNYCSIIDYIKP